VRTVESLVSELDAAHAARDLTTIVAKVEAVGPSRYVTGLALLENRFQFQRYLASRR
jgi:sulfopyruvate decarboxylase subunit beta